MYLFQPFHHNTEARSSRSTCPTPSQRHLFQTFQQFQSFQTLKIGKSDTILSVVKMTSDVSSPHARRDFSASFPRFGNSRNVETL